MRLLKSIAFTLCVFSLTARALAGGMEGGGGKGVRCATELRVLDLYEAAEIYHRSISQEYSDLNNNIAVFGTDIAAYRSPSPTDSNNAELRKRELEMIKSEILPRFVDLPAGTRLQPTTDATLPLLPAGCEFVQIAIYREDGKIYRDRELWDQLSVQDRAALILHEGIYHFAKLQGAELSDETRFIVGLAFAKQLPEPLLKPVWNSRGKVRCETSPNSADGTAARSYKLYGINESQNGEKGLGIYFEKFRDQLQVERVSAFIPGLSTQDLFFGRHSVTTQIRSALFGHTWTLEFQSHYHADTGADGYGIDLRTQKTGSTPEQFSWAHCEYAF